MIEVKNLVKRYGSNEALHGISFTFESNRVYGFLGPNGAGKSTTMNIITGCLAATDGEVSVNGHDIFEEPREAKRAIGYLPEQPPLYNDMTPEEYLRYVGRAKGLRRGELSADVESVIKRTGIDDVRGRLIKNLSKGYRQRVGIAQALLASPEIIILDEPTVGLDPKQIIEIRELIRSLGEDHTVILSSHILSEVSEVCDYAVIISGGRIVASDTIENLTTMSGGASVIDLDVRGSEDDVRSVLSDVVGVSSYDARLHDEAVHVRIECTSGEDIRDVLFTAFAARHLPIISMNYEETTLERVFLELTSADASETDNHGPADGERSDETGAAEDAESADRVESDAGSGSDGDEYEPHFDTEIGGDSK